MSKKLDPLHKSERSKRPKHVTDNKLVSYSNTSKISLKKFLNFLSSAYHINEALENSSNISGSSYFEWSKVSRSELFTELVGKNRNDIFGIDDTLGSQESVDNDVNDLPAYSFDLPTSSALTQVSSSSSVNSGPASPLPAFNIHVEHKPKKKGTNTDEGKLRVRSASTPEITEENKKEDRHVKRRVSLQTSSIEQKPVKGHTNKPNIKGTECVLKSKLDYVLSEGVLDSVLPYLTKPTNSSSGSMNGNQMKKIIFNVDGKKPEKNQGSAIIPAREGRKKATHSQSSRIPTSPPKDIEVEIHVCDEAKNLKKDFRCSQRLLISKMGYFAEVTTGQRLQDMDISVHCDVNIFEWLMNWCQKDFSSPRGAVPTLDATNVVPILVSASFLQMDPLLEICLHYCRNNINEIIKSPANLTCLNDSIVTRLANMFSNVELENVRDKKDKIRSRLYCKMIMALAHPEPEPWRGHFISFAAIYRCVYCKKLILQKISYLIACVPNRMRMNFKGSLVGMHARDSTWNLTEYVRSLKSELICWRKVYWHMWAQGHFLFCVNCFNYYPVYFYDRCWYHPESPQFFSMEQQRSTTFPVGRYPCCGAKAYRFESLQNPKKGCKCKRHNPMMKGNRCNSDIMNIFELYTPIIFDDLSTPPPAPAPAPPSPKGKGKKHRETKRREEDVKLDKKAKEIGDAGNCWWDGFELAPIFSKHGLLNPGIDKTKDTQLDEDLFEKFCIPEPSLTLGNATMGRKGTCFYGTCPVHFSTWTSHFLNDEGKSATSVQNTDLNTTQSSFSGEDSLEDEASDIGEGEDQQLLKEGCCLPLKTLNRAQDFNLNKPIKLENKRLDHFRKRCGLKRTQWVSKFSTRYNQDNQREYEEKLLLKVNSMLCQRTNNSMSSTILDKPNHASLVCQAATTTQPPAAAVPVPCMCPRSGTPKQQSANFQISCNSNCSAISGTLRVIQSRTTPGWNSFAPLGGTYVRLEAEWKDTHHVPTPPALCPGSSIVSRGKLALPRTKPKTNR